MAHSSLLQAGILPLRRTEVGGEACQGCALTADENNPSLLVQLAFIKCPKALKSGTIIL